MSKRIQVLLMVLVLLAAAGYAGYRFGKSRPTGLSKFTTVAATVVADSAGTPSCIKPDPNPLDDATSCIFLAVSQSMSHLTLGERVQATFVDALVSDGEAYQGWVISPLGRPTG